MCNSLRSKFYGLRFMYMYFGRVLLRQLYRFHEKVYPENTNIEVSVSNCIKLCESYTILCKSRVVFIIVLLW